MAGHPRLYRRGATYYHRAAIPVDIKDTYPKTEETFSLQTKDYPEAVKRVRVAAAQVDRKFEAHRQYLIQQAKPPLKELSAAEIKRIGEEYYAYRLEDDDLIREAGFYEEGEPLPEAPSPSFEEYAEEVDALDEDIRHNFARGKVDDFYLGEAEEVLTWEGIGIRLEPDSPSWRKLARELQAATIRAAEVTRRRNKGDVVETPQTPGLAPESLTPLLSKAVEDWIEEKSRTSWVPKTTNEHKVWTGHFISVIGDRPLDAYTKADARAFKAILLKLPANWVKFSELKGLPADKAADKAAKLGMKPMSDSNVNKLMGFVGSFWNWAADHYDEAPNPLFRGLKITIKKRSRDDRDPFSTDELKTIFSAPLYTGCKSLLHWRHPGDHIPKNSGFYWVPIISLFTGARLGEIIQLYTEDVREEDGVLFFDINADGEDKRLKTAHSHRSIPVHRFLVDMGIMKLVEQRKKKGEIRLFPELLMGEDGYYSSPFSKRFGQLLKSVGVKRVKNAFHSFRHCFEDACRDSDIPKEIMDALQGHVQEGMAERYGRGYYLKKLDESMQRLQFRDLDLDHLKRES